MNFELDACDRLDWEKCDGLLPAVVQHWRDGRVLMLGYMNRAALDKTIENGMVTFFSRNRKCLWTKGETSGHMLVLRGLRADCDGDALLVLAEPRGPTCHLGCESCFGEQGTPVLAFLEQLNALVARRAAERPAGCYTTRLLESGVRRIAQKLGEEAVETALAATAQDDEAMLGESADLIYHLVVLLRSRGLDLADVVAVLRARGAA